MQLLTAIIALSTVTAVCKIVDTSAFSHVIVHGLAVGRPFIDRCQSKGLYRRHVLNQILDPTSLSGSDSLSTSATGEGRNDEVNVMIENQRLILKQSLFKLCASYDRGFGATPRVRKKVEDLIHQLETMNPSSLDAAYGIDDEDGVSTSTEVPLRGIWRMIWTTALDVLNLGASPTLAPGGIHQVINPPIATNVIDLIPRAQSLFPTSWFPSTVIRAEVKIRTSRRALNSVRLQFESVQVKAMELFGFKTDVLPPLKFDLPRINVKDLPGVDPKTAPGYFDVKYLDDDLLIIRQSSPGGYFVSIRVDEYDP